MAGAKDPSREGTIDVERLSQALGYRFADESLLRTALTHPSYGSDHRAPHYQRLEFLGDAVLQLIVSEHLYARNADTPEGRLTFARAKLVREEALSAAARRLGLGQYLLLAVGTAREGGAENDSILCDALEAVVAAIYLDGGYEAARSFALSALSEALRGDLQRNLVDDKSRLQMHFQREGGSAPAYELVEAGGAAHRPVFTVRVSADGRVLAEGTGRSKQEAQQRAAHLAMAALEREEAPD